MQHSFALRSGRSALRLLPLLGLLTASPEALADNDSVNDQPPGQYYIQESYFQDTDGTLGSGGTIGPGDVDYLTLNCFPSNPGAPPRFVKYVWLSLTHAVGDLDIRAYTIDGVQLGISQGTTDSEYIPTYTYHYMEPQTVVLKVYGWQGATGNYMFHYECGT